jgi:N,N'-diacetylchitobiose phosphorylase
MGKDHTAHGRARHPWLTGTAAWFYTAVTKYILGVRPTYRGLEIDPCIPADWKDFEVTRKWRGATYLITVRNPQGIEKGVRSIVVNGQSVEGIIPIQKAGTTNYVEVIMGK